MARPMRDGVQYFSKDTDFYEDDKVRLLRAEFGAKGMYLLDYLLCDLYRQKGYFIPWGKNKCYLVSDGAGCGCDPGFTEEFVAGCIRCSFFDKRVFDRFGVLTSAGIQRRYVRMISNREEIPIQEEYLLLNPNDPKDVPAGTSNKLTIKSDKISKTPVNVPKTPLKIPETQQSKEKKSKVYMSEAGTAPDCTEAVFIQLPLNDKTLFDVTEPMVQKWAELYPKVDVRQELRGMYGWLEASPNRRKTRAGIRRFINGWLAREQDKGGSREQPKGKQWKRLE